MNDPRKFIWLPISVAAVLVATLLCPNADAQSFYQRAEIATDVKDNSIAGGAWQPPQTPSLSAIRPATKMVPLKPPSDIFTQHRPPTAPPKPPAVSSAWDRPDTRLPVSPPHVAELPEPKRFTTSGQFDSARRLGGSSNFTSSSNGLFDSINALTESGQPEVTRANFEIAPPKGRSDFDALTADASAKLGDAKKWVGEKTNAMLSGLTDGDWQQRVSSFFGGADIKRIVGGLAVVIGGYLGLVWLLKFINPAGSGAIPREALEVVGSAPLNSKQNLQLIRLGSKLMLMIHGPEGTQPVGEVNDPAEVDHLLAICGRRGRGKPVSPSVSMAIRDRLRARQQSTATASDVPFQQNPASGTANLSSGDSQNLNQLLSAIERYQGRPQVYEA